MTTSPQTAATASASRGGALVTGAGSGLGREIARQLAALGYAVHASDVDGDAAARTAQQLGAPAWSSALDVADAEACRVAAQATAQRAGTLAVWVNNAGILRTGPAWEVDAAAREQMFAVNTTGTVNGTFAALELMRAAARGSIVNVVSLAGLVPAPGEALYAASKHAALAFSVGVALDLRRAGVRGVHVSALCPDGIWTPMLHGKVDDPFAAMSWQGVLLQPEEVARAAVELVDRPRPVRSIPRRRGGAVRLAAAFPRVTRAALPVVTWGALRKQARFRRSLRDGDGSGG
jgi:NAD(P)-dependent dehydrogenase (short-subunit alcohol dehydrogenase family)